MGLNRRRTFEKKLGSSKTTEYKDVFDASPIVLIEQDWSPLLKLWNEVYENKGVDALAYLKRHSYEVKEAFAACKVIKVNKAALTLFNATSIKSLQENLIASFTADFSSGLAEQLRAIVEHGGGVASECKIKANGKQTFVLVRSAPLKKYESSLKRIVLSFQDITSRIRLEQNLRRLAQTDGLTKLLNHSAICERLEEEVGRAKRYGLQLTCLMVDFDNFKEINDTFGHQKGDRVLKATAQLLKKVLRRSDVVGRYGGDEFLLILTETPLEGAKVVAQRITDKLNDSIALTHQRKNFPITLSIGIGAFPSKGIKNGQQLIERADQQMYKAKKTGGNKIAMSK